MHISRPLVLRFWFKRSDVRPIFSKTSRWVLNDAETAFSETIHRVKVSFILLKHFLLSFLLMSFSRYCLYFSQSQNSNPPLLMEWLGELPKLQQRRRDSNQLFYFALSIMSACPMTNTVYPAWTLLGWQGCKSFEQLSFQGRCIAREGSGP